MFIRHGCSGPYDGRRPCNLAHVPFDFVVGERVFAAGPYAAEPSELAGMLAVRRADTDSTPVLVQAISFPRSAQPALSKLLFYCQRGRYFLAQVLTRASWRRRRVAANSAESLSATPLHLEESHFCPR